MTKNNPAGIVTVKIIISKFFKILENREPRDL